VTAIAAVVSCAPVLADTYTWTGNSGGPFPANNNWSNAFNWQPIGFPLSDTTTDLIFGPTSRLTTNQDLANPFVAHNLVFNVPGYHLTGLPIAPSFIFNDTNSLLISNNIPLTGTMTFGGEGSATLDGIISGSGNLVMNAQGTLTLNATNTFTGTTQINGGQVKLGSYDALAKSTVVINTNNGLNLNNHEFPVIGGLAGSGNLYLGDAFPDSAALFVGGNNASTTFGGTITGGYPRWLQKTGTGTLTLTGSGSSFYTILIDNGGVVLSGGSFSGYVKAGYVSNSPTPTTLTIQNGAVVDSRGVDQNYVISNSLLKVSGPSTIWRAGDFRLAFFQNTFGGNAIIENGATVTDSTKFIVGQGGPSTLLLQTGATITTDLGVIGQNQGAIATATVTGAGSVWTNGNLHLGGIPSGFTGGTGTLIINNSGAVVTTGATNFLSAPSAIKVNGGSLTTGSLASAAAIGSIDLTDPVGGALTINGATGNATYGGAISGNGGIVKSGGSTQTLAGQNTYTGPTIVNGGSLILKNGSSFAYTANGPGQLTLQFADLGRSSLRVAGGGTIHYPPLVIGGVLRGGNGTHDITAVASFNGTAFGVDTAPTQDKPLVLNNVSNSGHFTSNDSLTWDGGVNTSAGTLTVNGKASVTSFENDGVITVRRGGSLVNSNSDLVSGGGSRITIESQGRLELTSSELQLNGGLLLNNGVVKGTTNVHFNGMATGSGEFGKVILFENGRFAPGANASPAVFSPAAVPVAVGATFASGTALAVEIGGNSPGTGFDQVNVAGLLTAAGTLEITTTNGFVPATLDAFKVISFDARNGAFSTYRGTDAGNGLAYAPIYGATDVMLIATIPGDASLDGKVDFVDLVRVAQNYNTAVSGVTDSWWTLGDFTYDGSVDFNDLVILAQHYNRSAVPASIELPAGFAGQWAAALDAAVRVPEPSLTALLGVSPLMCRRRRSMSASRAHHG
jgi:autotransporter-associated beta strand protein/T5SS/PEP-CTERM-associated repeat protein